MTMLLLTTLLGRRKMLLGLTSMTNVFLKVIRIKNALIIDLRITFRTKNKLNLKILTHLKKLKGQLVHKIVSDSQEKHRNQLNNCMMNTNYQKQKKRQLISQLQHKNGLSN